MLDIPAILNVDSYKTHHVKQYSPHTEKVYSTWTPRKSRIKGIDKVVVFGLQYFIKDYLIDSFNKTFFDRPKEEVMKEFLRVARHFGVKDVSNFEALHDLGYLPLKICALEEGTLCPIRVPMFTIENTLPEFYWLTNFVETIMSTEIWKPMTSATIALQYRKIVEKWAEKTCDDKNHIEFQCHDFSYRGMAGSDAGCSSSAGHLLSFKGTDTIPAVLWLEKYYNANCDDQFIATSIPATEHAVAETNIIEIQQILENSKESGQLSLMQLGFPPIQIKEKLEAGEDIRMLSEVVYMNRLLDVYPIGTFSYVADTYNLWEVLTNILPMLKDRIMSREGKVVIRPDSGDPCDIICGLNTNEEYIQGPYRFDLNQEIKEDINYAEQRDRGVIQLLWDIFGGTVNSKGYKVLDPHIGCIYGDAITMERAEEICRRLEQKGFASSNIVFGVGSYTYNMNTRDTFGFALKATYGVVNDKELLLYKDPITDDGTKKSQKGRVVVYKEKDNSLVYEDGLSSSQEKNRLNNILQPVFLDGKILKQTNLLKIRTKIREELQNESN